ncbi:hypothetical protein A9K65_014055 [Mesorhizobium sp. WSM1497]|uniref:hypothetical protein n=1 Tax=Mesorhizobium sp. WSM1497 TaxID=278153 RepID=UPI0007EC9E7E|nr:hypothetical protein [Mesorhizobium sp. WSM1497]ARP64373.1 hypothetical protein A9K65_014055 [Mesorhizobium sp. WSM1497]
MDNVVPIRKASPRVEVAETHDEWVVRVIEADQEITRSFDLKWFAFSFAEGQRMRLGLTQFKRL